MAVRFVNNAMATSGAYTSAAAAVTNLSSSTTNTAENVDLQALEATEKTFKVTLTEGETNTGVAGQMFTDLKNTAFVATMHNVTYAIKSGTAVSMDLAGITCTLGEGKKEEAEAVEADTLLYVKIGNKKVANLAITEANGADTAENVAATVEVAITFLTAASDEDPTTAKVLADAFIKSYVATVTSATYTDTTKAISAIAALYGSEDAAGDDCLTKAMTAIAAYAYGYDASGTNTNKYDALLYIAMADDPATASGALKVAASAVTSTATVANVYTAIASDPETYAAAVIDYLTSFLSEDAIKNDTGDMMVNWGDIDEDGTLQQVYYPIAHTNGAVFGKLGSSAPTVSSPLVIKAAKGTLPIKMLAATLSGTRDITIDTKILHAEMASFDTTPKYSKYTVAPTDVTNGITVDDELAAKKEVLVRVIFLSSGDVGDDKSVGILTESTTTTDGVLAAKTLAADALKDYGVNKGKLAQLQQGYPYLVQFKVQFDGAASGSETTTAETYKLKASDVVLTGSDGPSKTVAASTKYAVSQDSAAKDALWTAAPVVFSVSSDQLASFEITVSADANVISAKASDGGDATITGKKIDFDGIEGTYTIILSSDLVASSDATKVSTDAGYFAITVDVLSVSVAPVVPVTPGSTEPGSTEPEPTEPTEPEGPVAVDPANAETTTSNGETVAAAGQAINNAFTGSNGASAISGLINSAKTAEMADAADVAGALGLDEAEIGDATKGYKAIGFEIPESQTMPAEGTPFFVITRNGSTNHVGFGYVPKRRAGYERILAVLFSLFRDPSDTEKYMVVDAGDNTVAATDSDGATSGNVSTVNRVVFVTADGDAFSVKTDGTVPLQGQDAKGNATEIVKGDDDDDDDNATSGHGGGSSGCDAGFGLIALAAVALAARKIRK
ncbi:MAG: hypothetical protein IJ667_02870 [Synergistaceae bacterium]|nr:hypothetical protein [Synergistaceae bacterium]